MSAKMKKRLGAPQEQGFTLIELSIVLVIIGLIVGGVLVGQDLIKAAQLRAEVTQLERYNTAVNTFRSKYNGVPGDLQNGTNFFGSNVTPTANSTGLGNGDGLVQGISATTPTLCLNCDAGENVVFWYELSQASLIPDNINSACGTYATLTQVLTGATQCIPLGKIPGSSVSVNATGGINYWLLGNVGGTAAAGVPGTNAAGLTPIQAFGLDTKIDDGIPGTGTVVSIIPGTGVGTIGDPGGAAASYCSTSGAVTSSVPSTYNVAAAPNGVNCMLQVRTNF